MITLVAATRNKGKLAEFCRILEHLPVRVVSQFDCCPDLEVEETGNTFAENAYLKAAAICQATGEIAFADDSGLCIDALGGEPGVYTARYGADVLGAHATDDDRMDLVLQKLQGVPWEKRTARFVSVISCVFPDGTKLSCEGVCEGHIGFEKRGEGGFGYDPIFYVGEQQEALSFAQMTAAQKDGLSHRGKAMALFEQQLAMKMQNTDSERR